MSLDYIPLELVEGTIIVKLHKEEIEKEIDKWKSAYIVFVIGETCGYNYMKKYMNQNWNTVAEPKIYYHEEGYYGVKF